MLLTASACTARKPIRIGLLSTFSGTTGTTGFDTRAAALLALDDYQKSNGRIRIEIIEYDDKGSVQEARQGARTLIDEGVVAIIGPFTSQTTMAAMLETEPSNILLLSPTAMSSNLAGEDDNLVRMADSAAQRGSLYADHVLKGEHLHTVTILADITNASYTLDWVEGFRKGFGDISEERTLHVIRFDSTEQEMYSTVTQRIVESNPSAVIILAEAFPTALIVQQIRKVDQDTVLYASGWAAGSQDLILSQAGPASLGLILPAVHFHTDDPSPDYLSFVQRYYERFGENPNPVSILTYDAFNILFTALETGVPSEELTSAVISGGPYYGLEGEIIFDEYGDAIIESRFTVIEESKP